MADKNNSATHHYDLRESTIAASSDVAGTDHSKLAARSHQHQQHHQHKRTQHTQHHGHNKTEHPAVALATGAEENLEHPVHLEHEHEQEHGHRHSHNHQAN